MLLDLRSLQEAHDLAAAGAILSAGNADLALLDAIAAAGAALGAGNADLAVVEALGAQGIASASGGGFLALVITLAGGASASSTGAATLALLEVLTAAGGPAAAGAADLVAPPRALNGAASARTTGFAELQIWTLGFVVVAVQVPRTTGSYILTTPISGTEREYVVSPADAGGGLVQVPPDELARFLRAVPGSLVVDPLQADLFRVARPFIAQIAGPFRGE